MHLPQAKLNAVIDRFHEVEARMSAASDGQEIVRLSKERARATSCRSLRRWRLRMIPTCRPWLGTNWPA
jgi:hypothetical protein